MVLARSLLAQSKLNEARMELYKVDFSRAHQNQVIRLDYLITEACVEAASGQRTEIDHALRTLKRALDESEAQGFVALHLEARLTQDEIELNSGDPSARDHLVSLQMDATKKGFGLIAQKAMRLALNAKQ
jgi:hypothetical protein